MSTPNLTVRDASGALKTLTASDSTGSAGPLVMQHCVVDPTNTYTMPTGDAQSRAIQVTPGDGTNAFDSASLAVLQAYNGKNVQLCAPPGNQIATASIVTGSTTPDATLSAPGAGKIYNVNFISIALACTVDQVPLLFKLVQDSGGTPLTLWQGTLSGLAKTASHITLPGISIPQTVANKSLDLSVITGTIASTNYITVTFGASITQ